MSVKEIRDFRVSILWEVITSLQDVMALDDVCPEAFKAYNYFVSVLEKYLPRTLVINYYHSERE